MPEQKARRQHVVRAKVTKQKYSFFLPTPLCDRLYTNAEQSRRKISAELELILERHFAAEDAAKASEQTHSAA